MGDLDASMSAIQWVVLAYLPTISSLLLAFGRLAEETRRSERYHHDVAVLLMESTSSSGSTTPAGTRQVMQHSASLLIPSDR